MSHGPLAVLAMFFDGFTGISRLLVLVALVLAVVNAGRFLARRRSVALAAVNAPPPVGAVTMSFVRGAYPSLWWPLGLLWLGFLVGGRFRSTLWVMAVGVLVALAVGLGVRLLRVAHARRRGAEVAPAAVAVLLTAGVLVLFGLLLTIRLVVVPDPRTRVAEGLTAESGAEAVRAVLVPALVLLLAIAALTWATRPRPAREKERGIRFRLPFRGDQRSAERGHLVAIGVVFALFALPLLGNGLTIAGIATPEYGKILYFVALAWMLADFAYGFRLDAGRGARELLTAGRHLWYPVGLFAAVGLASGLKQDIGPMIPMFLGTVAMFAVLLAIQANRAPEVSGARGRGRSRARRRVALRYSRPLWAPLALLVLIGAIGMVATPYISERGAVWSDPWAYTWAAECQTPPATATPPPVPAGTEACQISFRSAEASARSQIAQSLSVIADGGVWGRGLEDTTSGRVPAASTDFVISVVWSKLGGITVLLLAAVLALLAAALTRLGRQIPAEPAPASPTPRQPRPVVEPGGLFVVGLTAAILGQFLFVLAATVNALPHSGITAPFLSRGGHSTIALGLGVIAAVVVQYRSGGSAPAAPNPLGTKELVPAFPPSAFSAWWARPTLPAIAVIFVLCLTLIGGITLAPYNGLPEERAYCSTQRPTVVSTACSTDRLAYDRTTVRVALGGVPQYVRDRSGSAWVPIGAPTVSLEDLGGLLQSGGGRGAIDLALTDVIDGTSGTSLGQRLGPPSATPEAGLIELTVDPAIQRETAAALRMDAVVEGESKPVPPLAGGAVVMEADTGRVLATASAPGETGQDTTKVPVDDAARTAFLRAHDFGTRDAKGDLAEADDCKKSDEDSELDRCWKWSLRTPDPTESAESTQRRKHFVGDQDDVPLPATDVNRALGRQYGLGSTFKVVVATAYLRAEPGRTAESLIPAPVTVPLGNRDIRNANRAACVGTTPEGKITLGDALAVSCNTAFVQLALDMGWDAIRETAKEYGFTVGPVPTGGAAPASAWLAGISSGKSLGADSRVPEKSDGPAIGNDVLGGGDVVGTPLQMATVMSGVAAGGTVHQPTLLDAITPALGGERRAITGETRRVLSPELANELTNALAGTTSDIGTAHKLATPGRPQLWVKTGTQVQVTDEEAEPGTFIRQFAWLVGFLKTPRGPVAFAVVVETKDETAGAVRARWLAGQIVDSVVRGRR
ncbi:penicillin-binding transpeptidase domain-containing protein [Actinokineospora sp. NBRC 105648]|uniref:penicillin-binding transpeptidase domain-containing protein n=1 Tax=Actinokineospora sp. NBRC 105648 TaxID=3032206 RepID=UPI0024A1A6AC|nr:penicillin-binding transpeptidase domain-containing protein [Actinokineospora sp. NBRC 105648]GLZ40801.1 hypothetical protein Acsp05_44250 [Actinokineospora sp. NBRC 105648]